MSRLPQAFGPQGVRALGPVDWENPAVYNINKRKPHVPLRSFTDISQIYEFYDLTTPDPRLPRQITLDGDCWRFQIVEKPSLVPPGFWDPDFDASGWSKVRMTMCCTAYITLTVHVFCSHRQQKGY